MKKRLTAILLSLVMVFSVFAAVGTSVFAENENTEEKIVEQAGSFFKALEPKNEDQAKPLIPKFMGETEVITYGDELSTPKEADVVLYAGLDGNMKGYVSIVFPEAAQNEQTQLIENMIKEYFGVGGTIQDGIEMFGSLLHILETPLIDALPDIIQFSKKYNINLLPGDNSWLPEVIKNETTKALIKRLFSVVEKPVGEVIGINANTLKILKSILESEAVQSFQNVEIGVEVPKNAGLYLVGAFKADNQNPLADVHMLVIKKAPVELELYETWEVKEGYSVQQANTEKTKSTQWRLVIDGTTFTQADTGKTEFPSDTKVINTFVGTTAKGEMYNKEAFPTEPGTYMQVLTLQSTNYAAAPDTRTIIVNADKQTAKSTKIQTAINTFLKIFSNFGKKTK